MNPRLPPIHRAFDLTPACAKLLLYLYDAHGSVVSHDDIIAAVCCDYYNVGVEVVKVQVCKTRKAIGKHAVESVWGQGYRLTPEGIVLVRSVLEPKTEAAA